MSEGKVEIVFTANASQVVTATGQINASLARTATAGDAAGKAINSGMTGASASTSKALKALGPLGGVLSKISPEAGSAASSVAGLTGAFEGAAAAGVSMSTAVPVLLLLGSVLAAGAAAWKAYKSEAEAAARVAVRTATIQEADAAGVERVLAARYKLKEATGELTLAEIKSNIRKEEGLKLAAETAALTAKGITLKFQESEALRYNSGKLIYERQQLAELNFTKEEQAKADKKAAEGAAAAAEATAKNAAASERAFKAIRDELAVTEARTAAAKKYAEFLAGRLAEATKVHEAIQAQTLDEIATVNAKGAAAQEAISKQIYANKTLINDGATNADALAEINAKLEADRIVVAATTEAEITAIKDEESKKRDALRDAGLQAERDAADASFQTALQVSDAVMGLADQQLQTLQDSYDTSTEAGKAGALEVWKLQQALALSRAVLDVASAISAASTLPPPASFAAMGVAAVMGAINVAAVASAPAPEFAQGGFPEASTTGTLATLHPREAVLSQQGRLAMGDDTIREANAGRASKNSTTLITVYKHKSFDYFVADNLLTNGPLARTMRQGDRVGQIRRGRA